MSASLGSSKDEANQHLASSRKSLATRLNGFISQAISRCFLPSRGSHLDKVIPTNKWAFLSGENIRQSHVSHPVNAIWQNCPVAHIQPTSIRPWSLTLSAFSRRHCLVLACCAGLQCRQTILQAHCQTGSFYIRPSGITMLRRTNIPLHDNIEHQNTKAIHVQSNKLCRASDEWHWARARSV